MSGDSRVDMTEGAIAPKLLSLSWPLVAGNLLQTLYNLADVFWVGRVGADAVAAVSLMFPTSWMFVSTAMGITAATIALVSQHVGAGEDREADRVVGQTVLLTLAVSVVLAVAGFAFRHPLLELIGAEGAVFTEALAYIEVIFLSLPLTFLFFAFRAALQGAGDTKTAMWLMVASAGLNVVLDPILIIGWGPIAGMGTRGAAIATLVARLFATAAGVYILLRGDWGVRLRPTDLRPDPERLRKLVDIGYPATLDGWARSFSAVVMAAFVARFGPTPTAAYGIGVRLMSVSWTVSGAVGQATATGVGQNLGARTPDRAASVAWTAMAGTMGLLFAAAGLVVAFPAEAMRLFIDEQPVIDAGVTFLRIVAPSWAFFGGVMVIQGAFRGAGVTKAAMALSFLSRWIFRVPVALAVAFTWTVSLPVVGTVSGLARGVEGLWWAYVVGAVTSFAVAVAWFRLGTWREGVLDRGATPAAGDD
ncbi:MATE efflux family protein [Haloferax gibbonsii ATCC 33959]|uniref:Multidrug-efflux transporter n=1 Tax=Haloferax gibbonsii (strain ATCC 33959 / DSM 4427 / JCM 8863 / NBRC 102184 / NCIMB 2188 / Ma 2.38) TaxID=1227459 RepID=M0HK71_HALGM|nr:MATE family efflux transporter [Haloferax sp. Atlit-6N]ELZ83484.1 MATE efflux family protein [Haloferax gibbonsii ATCC 33959]